MVGPRFWSVEGAAGCALILGTAVQLPGLLISRPLGAGRYNRNYE